MQQSELDEAHDLILLTNITESHSTIDLLGYLALICWCQHSQPRHHFFTVSQVSLSSAHRG